MKLAFTLCLAILCIGLSSGAGVKKFRSTLKCYKRLCDQKGCNTALNVRCDDKDKICAVEMTYNSANNWRVRADCMLRIQAPTTKDRETCKGIELDAGILNKEETERYDVKFGNTAYCSCESDRCNLIGGKKA